MISLTAVLALSVAACAAALPLADPKDPSAAIAAISAFEEALAANPSDAGALRGLSEAYASVADPRADVTFVRALAVSPRDTDLRLEHAEFLWNQRRHEEGNAEMERLLVRFPSRAQLRGRYGERLMEQARFVQAASELSRACGSGDCGPDRLELWADALLETGRFADSARIWRRAIAREPGRAETHFGLGRLWMLSGDPRAALPKLEAAARLDPSSAPIRVEYGRALETLARSSRAESEYREALRLDPQFAPAHYALGTLLARLNREAEAQAEIALYRTAFDAGQERRRRIGARRAEIALGWTRLQSGDLEGALAAFAAIADDPEALRGQGEALLLLGRREDARRAFARAQALSPEDPRIRWALERSRPTGGGP